MPLYDIFFDIELSMCERFPGLTPFDIRREKAREVFLFIRRMTKHRENEQKERPEPGVIRRPAGDDWF